MYFFHQNTSSKYFADTLIKVSRSRNKIVGPAVTSPNKQTKHTQDTNLSAFRLFFGISYGSTFLFRD